MIDLEVQRNSVFQYSAGSLRNFFLEFRRNYITEFYKVYGILYQQNSLFCNMNSVKHNSARFFLGRKKDTLL